MPTTAASASASASAAAAAAATAAAAAATPTPPSAGKKKLLIMIIAAVVLAGGGAGAFFMLKAKPAATAADGKGAPKTGGDAKATAKRDPKVKPTFVQLESFTVNLADKDNERYAQVIFSIEASDAASGDAVKAHMPAIRGRVLMALSAKSATDLAGREGKLALAKELLAEARKAMALPDDSPALMDIHFTHFVMQ